MVMPMCKHLTVILTLLFSTFVAAAQSVKTISGEATYYGAADDSPAEARRKALDAARINALAREFGTVLSQTTIQRDRSDAKGDHTFFSSLSDAEVKGEWIADEGEPKYEVNLDSDGHYVVHCHVTIKARALSNRAAEFEAMVLRNGTTSRYEATDFRSGDDMKLRFLAPSDGYVAVYLVVGDDVMTLLPYTSSTSGRAHVRHGREYLFFDAALADSSLGEPDELTLLTEDAEEHNRLYVLFSPNEFTKALDRYSGDSLPRSLSYTDFVKWLSKVRRADDQMGMKVFDIMIHNK